jgi:hypothetical protein
VTGLAGGAHDLADEAPRAACRRMRITDAARANMQVVVAGCHRRRSELAQRWLALRSLICLGIW